MPNTAIPVYPSFKSLVILRPKVNPGWVGEASQLRERSFASERLSILANQPSNYPARAIQKQLLNLVPFSSLEKYLDRFLFPCLLGINRMIFPTH